MTGLSALRDTGSRHARSSVIRTIRKGTMHIARTAEITSDTPTVRRVFGELLERDGITS
jgi:hypothetical protein